jgi:cytochrome c2
VQGWSVSYGCCCRCNSIISTPDGLLTAAFTTSTGDRVQRGEEMRRTWVIAGFAVAASTGPTVGAGRRCRRASVQAIVLPCHEIGQDAKIKLGPPLNGIDGHKSGTSEGFNYSPANKSSGITWSEEIFSKYIRRRCKKCRVRAWHLSASKTTRTSQTSGPISSNSGLMGRRNEKPEELARGGKSKRAAGHQRLVLPHASCGLTGLLNPTAIWHKDYFNRIS